MYVARNSFLSFHGIGDSKSGITITHITSAPTIVLRKEKKSYMPTIELKPQPEFLVLLDRLVEALERNNELLNIANNRSLGNTTRDGISDDEEPARPRKQYVRKSEKKYDYGKIYALYEAGWRYQDIAEEVGCSHSLVGRVLIDKYGTSKKFSRKKGAAQCGS